MRTVSPADALLADVFCRSGSFSVCICQDSGIYRRQCNAVVPDLAMVYATTAASMKQLHAPIFTFDRFHMERVNIGEALRQITMKISLTLISHSEL